MREGARFSASGTVQGTSYGLTNGKASSPYHEAESKRIASTLHYGHALAG